MRRRDDLEFETCGFGLVEHPSAVTDWRDHAEVDRIHRPEVEALAIELTGCDVAISYTPIHRSREEAQTTPDYAPIELVHSDFTDDYGPMVTDPDRRYRAFLDPLLERHGLTHADVQAATRLMMLQFWRNTGPTRPDYPSRSVPPTASVRTASYVRCCPSTGVCASTPSSTR